MKLRTRVTLNVSLCFTLIAGSLILGSHVRQWHDKQRYNQVLWTGHQNTWQGVAATELQRLKAAISTITRNDEALRALAQRNRVDYASSLAEAIASLQADPIPVQFETAILNGTLFLGAEAVRTGANQSKTTTAPQLLSPDLIDAVVRANKPLSGLTLLNNGHYVLAVAFPLYDRSGPAAVGALYINAAYLLPAFTASIGAPAFLQHPDGSLAQGTDPELWQELSSTRPLRQYAHILVHTEYYGNKVYTVVDLPLRDFFNQNTATLLTIQDITTTYWRYFIVSLLAYGGIVVALALFLGGLNWYLRRAFRPLNQVIGTLNALGRGEIQIPALATDPHRDDEIGRLAHTVEQFRQAQTARAQLVNLRQELQIATRIQRSMLPVCFPERPEFELFAELHTVGEVGGDFYDFFDLPDGRLGMVMADVSGKGIAASLFMALSRTTLRAIAHIVSDPCDCLEQVNTLLSEDNDAAMFVTVFYGVLNPGSGEFHYVNAGHNPPYRIATDGTVTALPLTGGMALGVMEDIPFSGQSLNLKPGERLLFYTDGVTEAIDPQENEFTTTRLEAVLAVAPKEPCNLTAAIVTAVQTFADTAPQADDLTLMTLSWRG